MNRQQIKDTLAKAKAIPGRNGYFITTEGTVISTRRDYPVIMNAYPEGNYLRIGLVNDETGKQDHEYIHTLILLTYVGPRPSPVHQARHLDGDHHGNRLDNLAWGLPVDNAADRRRHGRYTDTQPWGEAHHNAKLTERDVLNILERLDAGERQKDIAADYGVTQTTISKIHRGTKWANIVRGFRAPAREAA